jgi:acetyl esterase/lipase
VSLRARLVRFVLRGRIVLGVGKGGDVGSVRRRIEKIARWAPRGPAGTMLLPVAIGGVAAERTTVPSSRADRHVFFLHGGGYMVASPAAYRDFAWRVAAAARATVTVIDYRLAPENPYPAALDDAVSAYRGLLAAGLDPRRIAIMGDSAGGGLALATLLRLREEGAPLPAAAVLVAPWTDLALTGASLVHNAPSELMVPVDRLAAVVEGYRGGADPRHPYVSPLYGDFASLPPTLIQVSSDEALLDDATRLAARMREAGCTVEIEIADRLPHVWHVFARVMPEARAAIARIGAFVQRHVPD